MEISEMQEMIPIGTHFQMFTMITVRYRVINVTHTKDSYQQRKAK